MSCTAPEKVAWSAGDEDCSERDAVLKLNMPMFDVDSILDGVLRPMKGCDPKIKTKMMRGAGKNDTSETEENVYLVKQEKQVTPYFRYNIQNLFTKRYLDMYMDWDITDWERTRHFNVYFLTKQKNYKHMLLPDVPYHELCKHSVYEIYGNHLSKDLNYNSSTPGVIVLRDIQIADALNKVLYRNNDNIGLKAILFVNGQHDASRTKHDIYHLLRNAINKNIYTKMITQVALAEEIDLACEQAAVKDLKHNLERTRERWERQIRRIEQMATHISRQIGDAEQIKKQNAEDRLVVVKQETTLPLCYQYYINPLIEEVKSISHSGKMAKSLPSLEKETERLAKEKLIVLFLTQRKLYKYFLLPDIPCVQTEKHVLAHALSDDESKDHLVVVLHAEEQDLFRRYFEHTAKRHVTLLVIEGNEHSNYQVSIPIKDWGNDIYVKLTTKDTLAEDIDQAVERHVLNGLKDCLEMMRKHALHRGLPALKGQIQRLEERVCGISSQIGDDQAPNKSALEQYLALPQEKVDEMISRANNIDNVIGCGFNKATLEIYIDESANTEGTEKEISELLRDYEVRYAVWKTKRNFRQFRSPGEEIFQGHRSGTLTGFVRSPKVVSALLSKHVAGNPGTTLYTMAEDMRTSFGIVLHSHESLDLSLAKVTVDAYCTRFKNEDGSPLAVSCTVKENVFNLQNLPVYIYGAKSRPGRGIIVTPRLVVRDSSGRDIHYVLIEDFSQRAGAFSQPGDSGAIVLAKLRYPERKAWAIAVVIGKFLESSEGHTGKYIALFLHAGLQHMAESFKQPLQLVTE